MNNWFHQDHHGRRGRSTLYTDQTICTFLMLKGVFSLSLRATKGLLGSLFSLMNVPLCSPDYSCVSKRASTSHKRSLLIELAEQHHIFQYG